VLDLDGNAVERDCGAVVEYLHGIGAGFTVHHSGQGPILFTYVS